MKNENLRKKLFEYGLWYTSRYPVSYAHFALKLEKRLKNLISLQNEGRVEGESMSTSSQAISSHISAVLVEISPYYDELSCARSLVLTAIHIQKPPVKLLASLRIKGYSKTTITCIQDEFTEYFHDFNSLKPRIEKKIISLLQKGYGEKYILPYLEKEFGWKQQHFYPIFSVLNTPSYVYEYIEKKGFTHDTTAVFKHLYNKGHSSNTIRDVLENLST